MSYMHPPLQSKKNFHELFSKILSQELEKFVGKQVSHTTSLEIYHVIFNLLTKLLTDCQANVRNDVANYIAQTYYDCISINCSNELDENIFTNRVHVQNLKTDELMFIIELIRTEPALISDCLRELRKRS